MLPWNHDEYYPDVVPGLAPQGEARTARVRWRAEWNPRIAVAFQPPRGASPALYGTLVDSRVDTGDVAAMLIDLAQRGWFGLRREAGDWRLDLMPTVPMDDHATPAEQRLLVALFGGGRKRVRLRTRRDELRQGFDEVSRLLCEQTVALGWYRRTPQPQGWARLRGRSPRTAAGSAARVQLLGFREYLATAEAQQIRFEESARRFSRYLPWALALGLADHWATVVGELCSAGHLDLAAGVGPGGLLGGGLDLGGALHLGGSLLGAAGEVADVAGNTLELFGAVLDVFAGLG